MDISNPKPVKVQGMNTECFVSAIDNTIKSVRDLQLVVIIFPNLREDRYNAVKRICCADLGIPSQVINYSNQSVLCIIKIIFFSYILGYYFKNIVQTRSGAINYTENCITNKL